MHPRLTGRLTPEPLFALGALLSLLLAQQLLVTLLELRLLAVRLAGRIGLHDGLDLRVVDHAADNERLPDGQQVREQVVVAQTARIVVEPEQQHERHEVEHHELHARHLRLRRGRLLVAVIGVAEGRKGHQQGEQRDVVPVEGDREGQVQHAVIRRQVAGPEERLPAQLD